MVVSCAPGRCAPAAFGAKRKLRKKTLNIIVASAAALLIAASFFAGRYLLPHQNEADVSFAYKAGMGIGECRGYSKGKTAGTAEGYNQALDDNNIYRRVQYDPPVIFTKNSEKRVYVDLRSKGYYHQENCKDAENTVQVLISDATKAGYTRCPVCKP